eukprot:3027663-Pleurochrysis_carterae.AAC.1
MGVPLHGSSLAGPEEPSQRACDQRTRGRAGAHAGPEPTVLPGGNRHEVGGINSHRQQAVKAWMWIWMAMMCIERTTQTSVALVYRGMKHEPRGTGKGQKQRDYKA